MDRLLIIDGMNLLFQMFYGMPSRITNSQGKPIHGVLGFVGALGKIIRMTDPTHIIAIFDGETHNPRSDILTDYKANRPDYSDMPEEETPFSQLPYIYSALDIMGICHVETSDCEADDLIAGYVKAYPDCSIVISSFDSDFFQLISHKVSVLRYRGDKTAILTPKDVLEKLGISPEMYAHHKALTGDSSDNIRGVPKVGPKTASMLINQFGGIENIIERANEISRPALKDAIISNADAIRRNHLLICLEGCDRLPYTLEQSKVINCNFKTKDILFKLGIL